MSSEQYLRGAQFLTDVDFSPEGKLMPTGGKMSVVFIIAEWCGHCRTFKPEIATILAKEGRVNLYIVEDAKDSTPSEKALLKRMSSIVSDFRGFPTVAMFDSHGSFVGTSDSHPRTAQGIKDWIGKALSA